MMVSKNYWLSLIFVVCALTCQFTGMAKESMSAKTRAMILKLPQEQAMELKLQAAREVQLGAAIVVVGYVLAIVSLVFCILSVKRKEQISRSVPIALLACYVLSQFLLI
jgi:hypothetical protein